MAEKKKKKSRSGIGGTGGAGIAYTSSGGTNVILPERERKKLESKNRVIDAQERATEKAKKEEGKQLRKKVEETPQIDVDTKADTPTGVASEQPQEEKEQPQEEKEPGVFNVEGESVFSAGPRVIDNILRKAGIDTGPGVSSETVDEIFRTAALPGASIGGAGTLEVKSGAVIGKELIDTATKQVSKKSIAKLSQATGKTQKFLKKQIDNRQLNKNINKLVDEATPLSLAKTAKFVGAGATALIGIDGIMVWYSLDNVIASGKIFSNELVDSVGRNDIEPAEATKLLDETVDNMQAAINTVKTSTVINPLLWPFRKLVLAGVEADERVIEYNRLAIQQAGTVEATAQREQQEAFFRQNQAEALGV